jgi:hypothetical protein
MNRDTKLKASQAAYEQAERIASSLYNVNGVFVGTVADAAFAADLFTVAAALRDRAIQETF